MDPMPWSPLVEPLRQADLVRGELLAQLPVRLEEARAELLESQFHLPGQAVAGRLVGLRAGIAPPLQRAVRGRRARRPEARAMHQQPDQGEGGDVLRFEDARTSTQSCQRGSRFLYSLSSVFSKSYGIGFTS